MHGGKSATGIASGTFKTGRWSKHLPSQLSEKYQAALSDPDLLAVREEIALVDARLGQLLARVDTGETGSLWEATQKAFKAWRGCDNHAEQLGLMVKLDALITQGFTDHANWREIGEQLDRRAALCEKEQKRLVAAQQVYTVEQWMGLVIRVADIIKTHVSDRKALAGIAADLSAILNRPATD